uniref:Uncharacterized protein n=1 Tax=Cannabis sativa TaxID=3483 RepID=A0A803NKK4_CANSA
MEACNIGCWNVKGVNSRKKQDTLVDFCNVKKIGIYAFLETKVRGKKLNELMENKFVNWNHYSSANTEGRLLVVWRKSFVRVIVIAESSQLVHCYVKMTSAVFDFCITFVYGFNTAEARKNLWEEMKNLRFPVKSWLVVGDFNAVFELDDRIGEKTLL